MIVFKNPGAADIKALTTHGVSVKEGANPIGVFGTGFKYAVPIVLRNGGTFTVYVGLKKYEFGTVQRTIRKQKFNIITMNGKELNYTDHMGFNWEPWEAYRELWSNCRDEGGTVFGTDNAVADRYAKPEKGYTTIVITGKVFEDIHADRGRYILGTNPLFELKGVNVHAGESEFLFYKGIRVMKLPKKSLYTYNITAPLALTENRTVQYPFMVNPALARAFIKATDIPFLNTVLSNEHKDVDVLEYSLPYNQMKEETPSPQFMEVADALHLAKRLNSGALGLYNHYRDTLPGYVSPYIVTLNAAEQEIVRQAQELVVARVPAVSFDGIQLVFKSSMTGHKVSCTRSGIMTLDCNLVKAGKFTLAQYILEGFCLKQEAGSVMEHLTSLLLSGTFMEKELTQQPAAASDLWF
jgi:hypothetical protein